VSSIRKLAGQTAIYGVPLILGRILGYLLVPLYVRVFQPGEYGVVNVFYSYAAFLMVVLTYGLETAFFRFYQQEKDKEKVYGTGMSSIVFTSVIFLLLVSIFAGNVASWIDYPDKGHYVIWFGWILAIDAFSAIPLARLRALNRASRFAMIRMANIVVNILLNLFFILFCPYILNHHGDSLIASFIETFYRTDWGIEYIFISNLAASALVIVLLIPEIISASWKPSLPLWRKMMLYALPLLFAGMAGVINETFDRLLLRYLLPLSPDMAEWQVGIYSACYKISILMSIFIQAFRYAAEPFFFAHAKESESREIYVRVMNYFIITMSFIFLATMVYLDDFVMPVFIDSLNSEYREGRNVIPVLMMAHLFLGVYINMSIWYKITGQTMWGAWFSITGAVITLALNFLWIPLSSGHLIYGYYGSAWATFICYAVMMVISYLIGQKYYPIPYNLRKITGYLSLSVLLYFVSEVVDPGNQTISIIFHTILLGVFGAVVILVEKPGLKSFWNPTR
jgi:O-antigen/teichoic acid export membrane protein